jgi:hypothetical protein
VRGSGGDGGMRSGVGAGGSLYLGKEVEKCKGRCGRWCRVCLGIG